VLPWSTPEWAARILWLASYALLLTLVAVNRRVTGFVLIGAGIASNLVAILANGGLMPAKPSALRAAGVSFQLRNNSVKIAHAHVGWLIARKRVLGGRHPDRARPPRDDRRRDAAAPAGAGAVLLTAPGRGVDTHSTEFAPLAAD
jgi:hypothetical protein